MPLDLDVDRRDIENIEAPLESERIDLYDSAISRQIEAASNTPFRSLSSGVSAGFTYTLENVASKHYVLSQLPGDLNATVTKEAAAAEGIVIEESVSEAHFDLLKEFRDIDSKKTGAAWEKFKSSPVNAVATSAGFLLGLFANPSTVALGGAAKGVGVLLSKASNIRFLSTGIRGGAEQLISNAQKISGLLGGQRVLNSLKPVINQSGAAATIRSLENMYSVSSPVAKGFVKKMFEPKNLAISAVGSAEVALYDRLESKLGTNPNMSWAHGMAVFAPAVFSSLGSVFKNKWSKYADEPVNLKPTQSGVEQVLARKGRASNNEVLLVLQALEAGTLKGPIKDLAINFVVTNRLFQIVPELSRGYHTIIENLHKAGIEVLPTDIFRWARNTDELLFEVNKVLRNPINSVDEFLRTPLTGLGIRDKQRLTNSMLQFDSNAMEAIYSARPRIQKTPIAKEAEMVNKLSTKTRFKNDDITVELVGDTMGELIIEMGDISKASKVLSDVTEELHNMKASAIADLEKTVKIRRASQEGAEAAGEVDKLPANVDEMVNTNFDNLPIADRVKAVDNIKTQLSQDIQEFIRCRVG